MPRQAAQDAATGTMSGPTVEFKVHFRNGDRGRRRVRPGAVPKPKAVEGGRIPRISRLMALAIHFDRLIRQGAIRDYADIARLGGVSRARVSQIMDLLNLAPDIQEAILFLPRSVDGREAITERSLRPIIAEPDWKDQRRMWDTRLETRPYSLGDFHIHSGSLSAMKPLCERLHSGAVTSRRVIPTLHHGDLTWRGTSSCCFSPF